MQGECPALILKVQERMGFLVGRLTMARDWQSLQERDSRRVKWASAGHRLNFVTNSIGVGLPKLAGLLPPPQAPMPISGLMLNLGKGKIICDASR